MVIRRDKPLDSYTSTDLVKYFARKYRETNHDPYEVNYARDAVLMTRIIYRFERAKKTRAEIFKFIDKMFEEYPKRVRSEPIDVRFLLATCHIYLKGDKEPVKGTKVETPSATVTLTAEIREWLEREKKKWLGDK